MRLVNWWKKHLARTSPTPNTSGNRPPSDNVAILSSSPIILGVSPAAVVVPRRRRRRRRRTGSVVGLPLYSEDPHDAEMTLFKHCPSIDSRLDSDNEDGDEEDEEEEEEELENEVTGASDSTSSLNRSTNSDQRSSILMTSITSSLPAPIHLTQPPIHQLFNHEDSELIQTPPPSSPSASINSPILRHHASYSVSSNTSTPSLLVQELGGNVTPVGVGRTRASTLRSIFNRNNSSSGSLPINAVGRSPYGQNGGNLPRNASSTSISSLSISSPIPHSLVSSNFVFPKAGLSPEQMTFISSTDSLGKYGYGSGPATDVPPPFESEPSNSSSISIPGSPTTSVRMGRNRGNSTSSTTSRLRTSLYSPGISSASPEVYTSSPLSPSGSYFPLASLSGNRNSLGLGSGLPSPPISERYLAVPLVTTPILSSDSGGTSITTATTISTGSVVGEDDSYFPKTADSSIVLPILVTSNPSV